MFTLMMNPLCRKMTHNTPLSRHFTAAQADFLRRTTWDLNEEDFVDLVSCGSSLDKIHGISVCIIDHVGGKHDDTRSGDE